MIMDSALDKQNKQDVKEINASCIDFLCWSVLWSDGGGDKMFATKLIMTTATVLVKSINTTLKIPSITAFTW